MFELVITSSVLILAVILLRRVLRGKISLRLQYALWALVAVRLLVPVTFGNSPVSVLNAMPAAPGPVYVQYTGDMGNVTPAEPPVPTTAPGDAVSPGPSPRPSVEPGIRFSAELPDKEELPANTTVLILTPRRLLSLLSPFRAAGIAGMAVWFLWVNLAFRKKLRASARPVDVPGCPLPVFVADGIPSPCLFGLLRPAVYLTPSCLENEARRDHVLAHELTHWRHRDSLWSLVRCLCLSIWWFHPLVWLAAALSRRDCELACDEGALAKLGEDQRTAYGRTLIGLMSVSASPSHLLQTATTMVDRKAGIKERLTLIAKKPKMAAVTAVAVVLIAAVAAVCTFTGAASGPDRDSPEPDGGETTAVPLTARELDWFNREFFNQTAGEGRMRNMFLLSTYADEKGIDLYQLFYNGLYGTDYDLSAEELEQLAALDPMAPELDVVKLRTQDMIDFLWHEPGVVFDHTEKIGLDNFWYLPDFNAYYLSHGDTNYDFCTVTAGTKDSDGLTVLQYTLSSQPGQRVVTLQQTDGGYQFRSNQVVQTVEEALSQLPADLEEEIIAFTPQDPPRRFELEENELFRAYCTPYYLVSSAAEPADAWVGSLYRFDQAEYDQLFAEDHTGGFTAPRLGRWADWMLFATDGTWYYVLAYPQSAPTMYRMEELGEAAYQHTRSWLMTAVRSCVGVRTLMNSRRGVVYVRPNDAPQPVLDAIERMSEDYVQLSLSGTDYTISASFLGIAGTVFPGNNNWMPADQPWLTDHDDAVSSASWVLTMTSQDGSASFRFYEGSSIVTCTVDEEVNEYLVVSRANFDHETPLYDSMRRWYDICELATLQSEITLELYDPDRPEYTGFGSDFPRYVVANLLQRHLDTYTQLPKDNTYSLSFTKLLSVEVFDMDSLDDPTRLCFNAEWVIAGPTVQAGQNVYTGGSSMAPITEGPHRGRWAVSGHGIAVRDEDGVWRLELQIGSSGNTADGDSEYLPDIKTCSDNDLMYFLLNGADGAYAEGGVYELGQRFLKRPEDILNTMTWYNGVQPGNWPDSDMDGADFLIRMLVSEFTVMLDGPDRERFASALARFVDEDCGGMVRNVRAQLNAYLEETGLNTPAGTVQRVFDGFAAATIAITSFREGENPVDGDGSWIVPNSLDSISLAQFTDNWLWTETADNQSAQNAFDRANWILSFGAPRGDYQLEFYGGTDLVLCICANQRHIYRTAPSGGGSRTLTDAMYAWAQDYYDWMVEIGYY